MLQDDLSHLRIPHYPCPFLCHPRLSLFIQTVFLYSGLCWPLTFHIITTVICWLSDVLSLVSPIPNFCCHPRNHSAELQTPTSQVQHSTEPLQYTVYLYTTLSITMEHPDRLSRVWRYNLDGLRSHRWGSCYLVQCALSSANLIVRTCHITTVPPHPL